MLDLLDKLQVGRHARGWVQPELDRRDGFAAAGRPPVAAPAAIRAGAPVAARAWRTDVTTAPRARRGSIITTARGWRATIVSAAARTPSLFIYRHS